ncbi:hypothetical protein LCGC14_0349630 [marine sediment metagenome]|uniref:Uncharacterized protein n=1 Tax=marine sediment metagenome TaxID=412755 RepID=A0A0F9VYE7_9ZZZZ
MPHTFDHQLNINGTDSRYYLLRGDDGRAMYQVIEEAPESPSRLRFGQTDWIGGHGQDVFREFDKYYEGQAIDTTQPGKVFLGPEITEIKEDDASDLDSAPVGFAWSEANTKWQVFTAGKIYLYGTSWEAATTDIASVKQMVEFDAVMYAGLGSGTTYYTSADGDTWAATDLTDNEADGWLVAPDPDGLAENLWKFKVPNELTRTTNGGSGGVEWESPTFIGETGNNITNIFLNANKIYTGKEDGLFWLDSAGGVHAELPDELKVSHSTDNFKYVSNWQTSSYFSLLRGMGEMTTAETFRPMGPLTEIDDIGKLGDIVGITSDRDWLYVAIKEQVNTIIYKCREVWTGQKLRWEYCPFVFLGTKACTTIKVAQHSTTDRRLWFGYGTNTGYVLLSDNPLADSAYKYTTSGFIRMSYTYGADPIHDKLWQSAVIEQHRVNSGTITAASAGETTAVFYRDDADIGSTSAIAAYITAGVVETNFSLAINDKRIQYELHLASNSNTATPVVYSFQAKGVEKPQTVRIHEAYYAIGDKPTDRVKTVRTLLREGRNTTTLIKFADLRYGQSTSTTDYVWCTMMPGYPKEVEVKHAKQRQPELALVVRLQEVSFTIS